MTDDDKVTGRSALLDFYGDRATSFASLFVASIFGLVATSAVIQAVLFEATKGVTFFWNQDLSSLMQAYGFIFFSAFVSLCVFAAFVYAVKYTLARFSLYADFADKLVRLSFLKCSELDEIEVETTPKDWTEKTLKLLKVVSEDTEKAVRESISKKKNFFLKFPVYMLLKTEQQKRTWFKKVTDRKWVYYIASAILVLALLFITYYPLIRSLLSNSYFLLV